MLTPIIRHGFTFWEAARSKNPPLVSKEDLAELGRKAHRPKPAPPEKKLCTVHQYTAAPKGTPAIILTVQAACMAAWRIGPHDFFSNGRREDIAQARIASGGICRAMGLDVKLVSSSHRKVPQWIYQTEQRYRRLLETDDAFRMRAIAAFNAVKAQGKVAA